MRFLFFFLLLPFFFQSTPSAAQACQPQKLIDACKKELDPYSYSNSRSVMTKKAASREISVSLLSGEKYRLVFNVARLPKNAVIKVYDSSKEESNRDLLMSSKDIPQDHERFIYEPPEKEVGGDIYISYQIPDVEQISCFTFAIGYKLSFTDK